MAQPYVRWPGDDCPVCQEPYDCPCPPERVLNWDRGMRDVAWMHGQVRKPVDDVETQGLT